MKSYGIVFPLRFNSQTDLINYMSICKVTNQLLSYSKCARILAIRWMDFSYVSAKLKCFLNI